VVDGCLKKILIDRDIPGAIDFVKKLVSDLLQNKIDLSQLVISKALSRDSSAYKAKQVRQKKTNVIRLEQQPANIFLFLFLPRHTLSSLNA